MNYFAILLLLSALIYSAFIFWCFNGWIKLKPFHSSKKDFITTVSVIIPARNEEENISNCLLDIVNQTYPARLFEIIVADDRSTDGTVAVVNRILKQYPDHKIVLLNNNEGHNSLYKKQAITNAVEKATGELIVTTDADCRISPGWLATIVSYYEAEHPSMIAGPVCFSGEKNNFEKLQGIEFMGLIGIGAGSISNDRPVMCNGANLAYTKKAFLEVNGFAEESETASGDDTQLMLKIAKRNFSKVHFLKSYEAIVYTTPMHSLQDLFHQRKRWASKIPSKMGLLTVAIASVAYLLHAGLFIAIFMVPFHHSILPFILSAFLLKAISEFLLLNSLSLFFRKKNSPLLFLAAQIIYLFYIVVMGAASLFGTYKWKGREIKIPESGYH